MLLSYQHIPYVATGIFVLIMAVLVIYLIRVSLKEKPQESKFEKKLKYALDPTDEEKSKESFISKKLRILPEAMLKAGIHSEGETLPGLQRKLLLMMAVLYTATTLMSKNMIAGFLPMAIAYAIIMGVAMYKNSKTRNLLEEQIPSFIATFKANIQANQHSQNAMVNAINNTASPLYEELVLSKSIMEAGDFNAGIVSLRHSTENETLRQMASCIELAATSGSNIENQIVIIENIIEDKQAIERKKKLGINENKPLFIVAAAMIPFAFVGSYLMSDMHRDYWFTTPVSWLILIGVTVGMSFSIWATWKVIKKVDVY